ncbi:MAG: insulinase family protein [Alphaproteobacteria bacterium]|nr:insulinase family protein [Alphaproteobacteria bacterium]MBU1514845.1 insulinase family protein [Alphaproteobacteria bacterium]MBU2093766.1 insulinase family protein [Alphaproteobacteria bacterium]MBU2149387.1 insulinase family protein [Alphaproteobacteria bacterium]MBU2305347.1 insulinase family protein [Alphaproteobacteria bacterium]
MLRTARAAGLALLLTTTAFTSVALSTSAVAAEVPPIQFKSRTLANGLKVMTSLDRATPNVSVQVWYGVGSKDDPQGRSGFAHLFEHLMFKATRNMPSEQFDRLTEDVGGFNNASTADDFTDYYEVVPASHLERLVWAEADRMSTLVVDEAVFKSERDVVKEELRQRVLASPYGRLTALYLPQASYTTHPYKRPGIGSIEELDAATVDDVRAFHHTYYRPDNAALIIVGNFDQAKLDAWIDQYFGVLKNPDQPLPKVTVKEPPRTKPGVFDGYGPNVPLPAVVLSWQGPAASDPDAPALKVLDAILSGGKSSRLYNSLVYDQQIAAESFSSADLPQDPGLFMVGAIMSNGKTIAQGETALLAQVKRLRDAPPTAAELSEAKNELLAGALRERETIEGRASAIGYALRVDGDPNAVNTELAKLQAVTAADVQRVAAKYLAEDRRMTIRYRPESERPKGEAVAAAPTPPKTVASYDGPVFTLAPEADRTKPPAIGEPVQPVLPKPAEKVLANGLRVIVARSSDLPLVTADLTVKTGAWADPQGLAGAASMMAGMLTEGTKTRSAQQIASQTESLGASLSSGGGLESSSVTLSAIADKLPASLTIMADVARNPAFAAEELERQREQALDGLRVAYQQPGSVAGFAAAPVIYGGTPFGHVPQGTPESIQRLKPADLSKLHAAWFRPDNAVLVLTGDISAEQGFALAQKAFGDWKKPATPLAPAPAITPAGKARAVAIDIPGTGQASVNVMKPAIARDDPDYYPGIVAASVLGGGYSARLNQEIRIKRGLSYGASARLSTARTTGSFRASAQTKNESATEVLGLINEELTKLGAAPAGADELKARKSTLVGGYGRELATSGGLADILGELALYGVPLDEVSRYTAKVEAVDTAQVQAFAKRIFDPAQASVVVAGDAKAFSAALKAKLPTLEVIPADQLDLESPTLRKK